MSSRLFFLVMAAVAALTAAPLTAAADSIAAPPGFAVVELFTSEGCSSCPPADGALARLSAIAEADHLPVYALEWHVDYWDNLGWKDPFDSHLATERQYAYARALPSSVYTPQVVMNGKVVPSWAGDVSELERDVRSLSAARTTAAIHLQVLPSSTASRLDVNVQAGGGSPGSQVLVALVEEGLGATPTAGENAGQALRHSSVVRSVAMLPAAGGEARLDVPTGVDLARASLVGFLQERSMRIVAVDRAAVRASAGARLSGRLVDPAGRALAGMMVQACSGQKCVPAFTNASGTFTFDDLDPGSWSLTAGPGLKPLVVSLVSGQTTRLDAPLVITRQGH
jgi:hypothetical protein